MEHFNKQTLFQKGDWMTLHSNERINGEKRDIAAICWTDRHRRHFVTTVGDVAGHVTTPRYRWKQFTGVACPTDVGVKIPWQLQMTRRPLVLLIVTMA